MTISKDPHNAFVEQVEIPGAPSGRLTRERFAVKDNVAVAGQLFTAGHPAFTGRRATATAPAVQALLNAGATFIGMTETDAGGFGASTPQTSNPAFPHLIVGGSSGGSAAAVAAGHCDFALGTDTGGSVRIPAACSGLTAFKPSYGRVSNAGVWPLTPQLDHVGLIADDLQVLHKAGLALLEAALDERKAPHDGLLRIAVEIDRAHLFEPGIVTELEAVADTLDRAGHEVKRIAIPARETLAEAHGIIVLSEAAAIYGEFAPDKQDQLGKAAARALRHSEGLTSDAIEAAWEWTRAAAGRMQKTLEPFDVLISPTLPVAPPAVETRRIPLGGDEVPVVVAMTLLTCLANLTGNPVIAFPNPKSLKAPQTGLQVTGHRDLDETLLLSAIRIQTDLSDR